MRSTSSPGVLAALALVALSACVAGSPDETPGRISAVVRPAVAAYTVTAVTVAVDGGEATALDQRPDGSFAGTIFAPVGVHTITGTAYAGAAAVASGSANVTVEASAVASVFLKLLDATGPAPAPDHGPIVTSLSVSNVAPFTGEPVQIAATALDPDGDALTLTAYANCAAGTIDMVSSPFPTIAATWTPAAPGDCTILATAEAKGLIGSLSIDITVRQFTGGSGGSL